MIDQQIAALPDRLRHYQRQGVNFLVSNESALLADEMGLGKTVQVIVALRVLLRQRSFNRAIIVVPASLRINWQYELSTWAPELPTRLIGGSAVDRRVTYALPVPVQIASYEQVREDALVLGGRIEFDIVVLDEAQRIKNPGSDSALACRLLPRRVAWALTGTPVENKVADLLSVFRFLSPGLLNPNLSRRELHRLIQPHFLRRRRQDVLPELPNVILNDVRLQLEGQQLRNYDILWNHRHRVIREGNRPVQTAHMLALITKLKKLCNYDDSSNESAKFDTLRLILDGLSAPSDKLIVFSQYVATLKWLSCQMFDVPHEIYHGGLSIQDSDDAVRRFREMPGPRALLMSLKAGGVGLNLPEAAVVVLFDRWWNPAVEDQAISRANRFGRTSPLLVYRFVVEESIESRIEELLARKQEVFERYVNDAPPAEAEPLSRTELRRLLAITERDVDHND